MADTYISNIPLSNFFPSLLIALIVKMSSKTMLDVSEAMEGAPVHLKASIKSHYVIGQLFLYCHLPLQMCSEI